MIREPAVPRSLRKHGYRDISTAPLMSSDWYDGGPAKPILIDAVTSKGVRIIARYHAAGDYEDRWTNANGTVPVTPVYWRPLPRR